MIRKDYEKPTLEVVRIDYRGPLASSEPKSNDVKIDFDNGTFSDGSGNTNPFGPNTGNPDDID